MNTRKNGDPRRVRQAAHLGQTSNVITAEMSADLVAAVERINIAEKAVADTAKEATDAAKKAKAAQKAADFAAGTADDADAAWSKAKEERKSCAGDLGHLLIRARDLHVSEKTFLDYLDKHINLKKSRAHEYMNIARGKVTEEQNKRATRERVKAHRAAKRAAKAAQAPKLTLVPPSVTPPDVTDEVEDGPQASADRMRAEFAANEAAAEAAAVVDAPTEPVVADATIANTTVANATPIIDDIATDMSVTEKVDQKSAEALAEFKFAVRHYFKRLNAADLEVARAFAMEWQPKVEAAAPAVAPEVPTDLSIPADLSIPPGLDRRANGKLPDDAAS